MLNNSLFSTQMLNNLINDLLDMAKFEQGKFIFQEHYFSLPHLVIKALNMIKYFADEKEILLIMLINSKKQQKRIVIGDNHEQDFNSVFSHLYGDERRFLQILLNFISNALKFTKPGGSITVRVSLVEIQKKLSSSFLQKRYESGKVNKEKELEVESNVRRKT